MSSVLSHNKLRKTVVLGLVSLSMFSLSACDSGIFQLGKPKPPVTTNFNNPDAGADGWITPAPPTPKDASVPAPANS
jgi:hypothetical protein